jgi:crotonobetainyl-CoA:carnitine CoA-transferase CaiB-like acyl-CoA transferase
VARERTGFGQQIDIAMLDTALFVLWPDNMLNDTFTGANAPQVPRGTHENFVRKTRNGYICTMPVQEAEWLGLFRALELPNLLTDPTYQTDTGFDLPRLHAALGAQFEKFTTEELLERLDAEQVPFARINARDEVVDDPQVQAMESLWEFEHPVAGPMRQARAPARFSETPSEIFQCSPELGEHTAAVLREIGLDDEAIKALRDAKVVA